VCNLRAIGTEQADLHEITGTFVRISEMQSLISVGHCPLHTMLCKPHAKACFFEWSRVMTLTCRILEKHAAREALWASHVVRLGAQFGKKPQDVTLARVFEFRQRQEKVNHIEKSRPAFERVTGATYWQISLRNAYSRYIPLGNEFSGAWISEVRLCVVWH
jgi:hypothetical protein